MDPTLRVCIHMRSLGGGASCAGRGSEALLADLHQLVAETEAGWKIAPSTCLGQCRDGPNVKGAPGGPILNNCTDARAVLERMRQEWPNGLD